MMSRFSFLRTVFVAALLLGALGGCSSLWREADSSTARNLIPLADPAHSPREAWQRMARALVAGRAYDRGVLAARRDDASAFRRTAEVLREDGFAAQSVALAGQFAVGEAERTLQKALRFDALAQVAENPGSLSALVPATLDGVARADWREAAAHFYRQTLKIAPDFDSPDPAKLNALGYFLAERGEAKADFVLAEKFTRRSLDLWDEVVAQSKQDSPRLAHYQWRRAVEPRDSLAWALFRQRRFEAACREAERAVREAQVASQAGGGPMSEDLHFHLGEIYRTQGRINAARQQYQAALKLNPQHAASRMALDALPTAKAP